MKLKGAGRRAVLQIIDGPRHEADCTSFLGDGEAQISHGAAPGKGTEERVERSEEQLQKNRAAGVHAF
jgi:hypothetical protein